MMIIVSIACAIQTYIHTCYILLGQTNTICIVITYHRMLLTQLANHNHTLCDDKVSGIPTVNASQNFRSFGEERI